MKEKYASLKAAMCGKRRMGNPKSEKERKAKHKKMYGSTKLPKRGTGLKKRAMEIKESQLGTLLGGLKGLGKQFMGGAKQLGAGAKGMAESLTPSMGSTNLSQLLKGDASTMLGGLKQMAPAAGLGAGAGLAGYGGAKALGGDSAPSYSQYMPRFMG
ncbi:MAG: hypothetical protein ACTSPI_00060 [Candidatus Heimdallarchaeaceae archaeon]